MDVVLTNIGSSKSFGVRTVECIRFCIILFVISIGLPNKTFAGNVPCTSDNSQTICSVISSIEQWRADRSVDAASINKVLDLSRSLPETTQFYATFAYFEKMTRLDPEFFYSQDYFRVKRAFLTQLGQHVEATGDHDRRRAYQSYLYQFIEPLPKIKSVVREFASRNMFEQQPKMSQKNVNVSRCLVEWDQPQISMREVLSTTKFEICIGGDDG